MSTFALRTPASSDHVVYYERSHRLRPISAPWSSIVCNLRKNGEIELAVILCSKRDSEKKAPINNKDGMWYAVGVSDLEV